MPSALLRRFIPEGGRGKTRATECLRARTPPPHAVLLSLSLGLRLFLCVNWEERLACAGELVPGFKFTRALCALNLFFYSFVLNFCPLTTEFTRLWWWGMKCYEFCLEGKPGYKSKDINKLLHCLRCGKCSSTDFIAQTSACFLVCGVLMGHPIPFCVIKKSFLGVKLVFLNGWGNGFGVKFLCQCVCTLGNIFT